MEKGTVPVPIEFGNFKNFVLDNINNVVDITDLVIKVLNYENDWLYIQSPKFLIFISEYFFKIFTLEFLTNHNHFTENQHYKQIKFVYFLYIYLYTMRYNR